MVKAGGVFPPGHATTGLCLKLLQETLAAFPVGMVLDVGCGSGILALAAAALGVPCCLGVDLTGAAARRSLENARDNGLAERLAVAQGSTECLKGPFGLILANLPWEVQLAKAPELLRLAAPEGTLILSGFKDTQEEALLARYRQAGWSRRHRLTRDEWVISLPPEKSYTWVAWALGPGSL